MRTSRKLSFWIRKKKQSNAEVDYIIQSGQYLIPIEVKAGKTGSLHQFVERSAHPFAVRLNAGPVEKVKAVTPNGKQYDLLSLPYFLSAMLQNFIEWLMEKPQANL